MLQKQYTKLLGTPILNRETGVQLGEVYDVIIDVETGKLEAFWIKEGVLSGATKILSLYDVTEWKLKVYVSDSDAIISPEEILKVREIVERNIHFYLHKVKTISGEKLGKVFDFFIDPISGKILQIQVSKCFLGICFRRRLIAFSEIHEVTDDAVVLKDNYKFTPLKMKEVLDLSKAV